MLPSISYTQNFFGKGNNNDLEVTQPLRHQDSDVPRRKSKKKRHRTSPFFDELTKMNDKVEVF
jgi:hypothetical protein